MFFSTSSDETLISAFRAGDENAFNALLDRYEKPLWRRAYRLSWNKDESFIDVIHSDILYAILEGIKNNEFDPAKGPFKNWAYGICRNICLAKNREFQRQEESLSERYPEEFPDDLADKRPPPPDYDQKPSQLADALAQLSEEERLLVNLALVENKSYQEIARIKPFDRYKDNPAALRQKTCRLRRFLVSLLKREGAADEPE